MRNNIMDIGKAIKDLRKQRNISQLELAEKIGLSQTSISHIELGIKRPSSKNLTAICKELNVSEPLLYILAIESSDIPKEKQGKYETLFPIVKSLIEQIVL